MHLLHFSVKRAEQKSLTRQIADLAAAMRQQPQPPAVAPPTTDGLTADEAAVYLWLWTKSFYSRVRALEQHILRQRDEQ